MTITEPTVIYDLDEAEYHGHEGSLSASGAKWLAPPDPCPAKFVHYRDNPEVKDAYDFGHVVHRIVLGRGSEYAVLDFEDRRTKAYKEAADAARESGRVPILAKDFVNAKAAAERVLADPVAGPLFTTEGHSEVSLFWPDAETGVVRRARIDRLRPGGDGRRAIIGDLKTAASAAPTAFGRAAADYGYAISAANYVDGLAACGLGEDAAFVLVVVEKREPYVVSTYQVTDDDLQLGRYLMRKAIDLFAECTASNSWPAYTSQFEPLELPYYFTRQFEDVIWA